MCDWVFCTFLLLKEFNSGAVTWDSKPDYLDGLNSSFSFYCCCVRRVGDVLGEDKHTGWQWRIHTSRNSLTQHLIRKNDLFLFFHLCCQSGFQIDTKSLQRSHRAENEQPPACHPSNMQEEDERTPKLLIILPCSAFNMFICISNG